MEQLGSAWGGTEPMRALFAQLRAAAYGHGGILLRGEDGTGRETLGQALHQLSRPERPLVIFESPAVPLVLQESVLHGHERSTWGGGMQVGRGIFEEVESGTLVIREIAAIPLELQRRLLRVLERREFRRIGSNRMRPFHGRIIATTHCDLAHLVTQGVFLHDLLKAITADGDFTVPPLRDRSADVPGLLERAGAPPLDGALVERLAKLAWRGNVGQLVGFARSLAASTVSPASAVTELELLEAIFENPDDDAPRLVYGDLLAARGDPRGELITVQCRLADPAYRDEEFRLRAAEKRLLDAHHAAWAAPIEKLAGTPTTIARATFRRGFVERLEASDELMPHLDELYRLAPLAELEVIGEPHPRHWVSPHLRRIRTLAVHIALDTPEMVAMANCEYVSGVRTLRLVAPGRELPNPLLAQAHLEALAGSLRLAQLETLALDGYVLDHATRTHLGLMTRHRRFTVLVDGAAIR